MTSPMVSSLTVYYLNSKLISNLECPVNTRFTAGPHKKDGNFFQLKVFHNYVALCKGHMDARCCCLKCDKGE